LASHHDLSATPNRLRKAAVIWAYALAWFLVNDEVKLGAYALLDRMCERSEKGLVGGSAN
jgi:H+-transporting ATPase